MDCDLNDMGDDTTKEKLEEDMKTRDEKARNWKSEDFFFGFFWELPFDRDSNKLMDCLFFHCDLIVWKCKRLLATVGYDQTMSPLSPIIAALLFKFLLYRHHFLIIFLWIVSHFLTVPICTCFFFPLVVKKSPLRSWSWWPQTSCMKLGRPPGWVWWRAALEPSNGCSITFQAGVWHLDCKNSVKLLLLVSMGYSKIFHQPALWNWVSVELGKARVEDRICQWREPLEN